LFATIIVRFFAPGRGIEIPASFMADIDGLLEIFFVFPSGVSRCLVVSRAFGRGGINVGMRLIWQQFGLPVAM
jgi:hypothetical protein